MMDKIIMKKEDEDLSKEKVQEVYKNILDNFPFEKYEKLIEGLEKIMTDPKMKKEIKLYFKELSK